jgi:hypothetical protein
VNPVDPGRDNNQRTDNRAGVMSASLIVHSPVVLLGIFATFCFVGRAFRTGGIQGPPFAAYTNTTVIDPLCIGYWPHSGPRTFSRASETGTGTS